jgi:excisionase family DNA binding protein
MYEAIELPQVLTPEEARSVLRLGRTTFYEALRRGELPFARRVGRQWRIGRDALLQWIGQDEAAGLIAGQPAALESEVYNGRQATLLEKRI